MGKSYGNYDMTDRIIDDDELNEIIRKFSPLVCWKVGLSIGSMIHFDMGDRLEEKSLDGSMRHVGSASLWLHGDTWVIREGGENIISSEEVYREFVEKKLSKMFSNQELEKCFIDNNSGTMTIYFSDYINIIAYSVMEEEFPLDEGLVDFVFPDGRTVYWNNENSLYISDTLSNV